MYAQIGNIILNGLIGFATQSDTVEQNLAEQSLIKGKPRLQLVGRNLNKLSVTMNLHAQFVNVTAVIDELKSYINDSKAASIIEGNGRVMGTFYIQALTRDVQQTDPQGRVIYANVSFNLIEAASTDRSNEANLGLNVVGAALVTANPPQAQAQPITNTAAQASLLVTTNNTNAASISSTVNTAQAATVRPAAERIISAAASMLSDLTSLGNIINADPDSVLFANSRTVAAQIAPTTNAVTNLRVTAQNIITNSDQGNTSGIIQLLSQAKTQASDLTTQVKAMMASSTALISFR